MKSIKVTLGNVKQISIDTFSDWHIGDKNCDLEMIKELIERVRGEETSYVILNGDLMNIATKNSVSDIYNESLTPMEQLEICVELLKPIKDRILLITEGNHERRIAKESGINLTKLLAIQLGLEDRYSPSSALLFLRLGELGRKATGKDCKRQVCYTIYVTHGTRGGRSGGSKINALLQMASIIDADIYIHSHTHLGAVIRENFFRTDVRNSTIAQVEKLFINTSSALDYGGYGEIGEYKPTSKVTPTLILRGDKKTSITIF